MSRATADEIRNSTRSLSAADFAGTIQAHYPFWDARYRPFLLLALDAFPAERFDWKPRPEMLTASQTFLHIAEAERSWIHHILDGGAEEDWLVPHADSAQGWVTQHAARDPAALRALLEEWHRPTQRWFAKPATELGRVITYTGPQGMQRSCTVHWVIDHVQEHEIHHRAQLNLYLRLMGIEPPSV